MPRRALVVIDIQQEYFDGPLAIQFPPREDALARVLDAIVVAQEFDLPIVIVQHESPATSPVFAAGSASQQLHPQLDDRMRPEWLRIVKRFASVFDETELVSWCRDNEIDTLTLVGFMTNNCVLATAAGAAPHGLSVEVLSDATGAINLSNEAGSLSARQIHKALMILLHSNFAAVTTTDQWDAYVRDQVAAPKSNLIASATQSPA